MSDATHQYDRHSRDRIIGISSLSVSIISILCSGYFAYDVYSRQRNDNDLSRIQNDVVEQRKDVGKLEAELAESRKSLDRYAASCSRDVDDIEGRTRQFLIQTQSYLSSVRAHLTFIYSRASSATSAEEWRQKVIRQSGVAESELAGARLPTGQ